MTPQDIQKAQYELSRWEASLSGRDRLQLAASELLLRMATKVQDAGTRLVGRIFMWLLKLAIARRSKVSPRPAGLWIARVGGVRVEK